MSNFYDELKNAKRQTPRVEDSKEDEFRDAMAGVTPLKQDKINVTARQRLKDKQRNATQVSQHIQDARQQQASFTFSDMYQTTLPSEGPVRYCRQDEPAHSLKRLRRGDYYPELMLDLHGLTRESAKQELTALIHGAQKQMIDCVSVMHGFGQGVLRQALPHYLVQHPNVRAFHQAPKEYGGKAALLVLLDTETPK
ncbi:endonuclease SmrB [Alteromonas halophila]|uniref:Ribosome rescue factor SmrB n=1 Tax=Alteromonas halophila TaxID=516698 RepID=A0A918JDV3_9ALTE|nr:endonuclease SmrB [Alteromonas halophila]GGW74222.1 UPF0115 protein YfcN [Alteromonas halophila]